MIAEGGKYSVALKKGFCWQASGAASGGALDSQGGDRRFLAHDQEIFPFSRALKLPHHYGLILPG
jgi:hypothetical protein